MTDALVFGTFDQIPANNTTVELEQSVTPSSSASTLPPQETETINWIDFGDFNGLSPATANAFDPMLLPTQTGPLHHPVMQQQHHQGHDTSEQALLSTFGHFFAPLDHHHHHNHHNSNHHNNHTNGHHNHHTHYHPHHNHHPHHHARQSSNSPTHSPDTNSPQPHSPPVVASSSTSTSTNFRMPSDTRAVKHDPFVPTTAVLPTDLSALLLPSGPSSAPSTLSDDDKWQAVLTRDPAADAAFVYCVTSTRIYCRPTCASRRPLRANTVYADTPAEAELLGYRACRRCLPHCLASASEMRQVLAVEQAKVVIHDCVRDGRPAPSLSVLAQHVGMSKFHLQRTFKRLVGHSPDAHAKALAKAWRGVGRG